MDVAQIQCSFCFALIINYNISKNTSYLYLKQFCLESLLKSEQFFHILWNEGVCLALP